VLSSEHIITRKRRKQKRFDKINWKRPNFIRSWKLKQKILRVRKHDTSRGAGRGSKNILLLPHPWSAQTRGEGFSQHRHFVNKGDQFCDFVCTSFMEALRRKKIWSVHDTDSNTGINQTSKHEYTSQ